MYRYVVLLVAFNVYAGFEEVEKVLPQCDWSDEVLNRSTTLVKNEGFRGDQLAEKIYDLMTFGLDKDPERATYTMSLSFLDEYNRPMVGKNCYLIHHKTEQVLYVSDCDGLAKDQHFSCVYHSRPEVVKTSSRLPARKQN